MAPFCWGSWGEGVHQAPVLYNPVDQGIRKINWEDRVGGLFLGTSIRKRFSTSIEVSMWDQKESSRGRSHLGLRFGGWPKGAKKSGRNLQACLHQILEPPWSRDVSALRSLPRALPSPSFTSVENSLSLGHGGLRKQDSLRHARVLRVSEIPEIQVAVLL